MKTPTEYEIDRLMHAVIPTVKASTPKLVVPEPKPPLLNAKDPRSKQRAELAASIRALEQKLQKLEALSKKMEQEDAAVPRTALAKRERAAKENSKPQTAAEKAKIDRANKRLRDKNQQKSNTAPKAKGADSQPSASELKLLATRVKGQVAVAKQKLSAL